MFLVWYVVVVAFPDQLFVNWKRYLESGAEGLYNQSKRPHNSPNTKLTLDIESRILDLRKIRNLGVRRLQSELLRNDYISLSIATIHKVLSKHQVRPVKKFRQKHEYIRYELPLPGDRVQMDICKFTHFFARITSVHPYFSRHL